MATNKELSDKWRDIMVPNYATPTIAISHGKGSYVWDVEGKKYLDLLGGIAVSVLGHAHEKISEAVSRQSQKLLHTSNLYIHENELELAQRLTTFFGSDSQVFFCQDGATANEAALKLARKHGYAKAPDGSKQVVVAMKNGFHGRTSGALSITGNQAKRDPFAPFGYEVRFVEFNNFESLNAVMSDDVTALFVEPVQGEGGMHIGSTEFLKECQNLCKVHDALFVVDEVQSGVGRSGSFYNFTQHNLNPDIVTLAKGLAGGLPIGAVIAKRDVAKNFEPGDHGSTFGGNPVSIAAALVVVEEVSDTEFLQTVQQNSIWLSNALLEIKSDKIIEVRFSGLWFGIEFNSDIANSLVSKLCDLGFLVNAVRANVLRLAPPLNISKADLQDFVDTLKEVLDS